MTNREQIERQIHKILTSEMSAATLSEKLFSPSGLFNALAPTEPERRALVRSELFVLAQMRFRILLEAEAAEFSRAIEEAEAAFPGGQHRLKVERVEIK